MDNIEVKKESIIYKEQIEMPMIPLRGISISPCILQSFDIGRTNSIESFELSMINDEKIFLVSQFDAMLEEPTIDDLYTIGTICNIKQVIRTSDSSIRVLVEGVSRAKLVSMRTDENNAWLGQIIPIEFDEEKLSKESKSTLEAYLRRVMNGFEEYLNLAADIPTDSAMEIAEAEGYSMTMDIVASSLMLKFADRQNILVTLDLEKRMELLYEKLLEELEVIKIDKKINLNVRKQMNKIQKDYYLREQLKAIQKELGDIPEESEESEYRKKLSELKISEETREKIEKEIEKFERTPIGTPDYNVSKNYLDVIFSLPWNKESRNRFDIKKSEKILNEDHYGLDDVKERILEYLAVRKQSKNLKSPIICLVGPPGVGKTSIAKSVSRALGRHFVRISLGGVRDEAEIRGHRRTYIGAIPGRIINSIKEAKSKNPVILLDEIDKMAHDFKGDPTSAMLEVLDPEQNKYFVDHYLELPFDLSKVLFITTANDLRQIPRPLYDRMEVIDIEGYIEEEKLEIVKRYILKKQLKENGLKNNFIKMDDEVIKYVIGRYTRESGVRQLERTIAKLCRKVVKEMVENPKLKPVKMTKEQVRKYLGPEKFKEDPLDLKPQVGLVNGLAWTSVGGVTLEVEVGVVKGKGNIVLTGMMGDVMKESARTGISYIRSVADELSIDPDFYKEKDIHIHIPEGATPKDGPSAGITMTLATISALTGRSVPGNIAMTGEITLRGRVLPVGGIREKVLAAYRMGIRKIILPKDCQADLEKIPENVRKDIEFVLVENMKEVIDVALMEEKGE
ncbi:endopeptidase La [Peptostreptococcus equinus]|uniref:Lon protease n=1 Tax=Peptostreptococcus equinus TaxID=3003601 RepID=A0ABY7JPD9_9FIRM|nr:endopeptidase La [Peptostreptococcus sp. CBA3647]WAW15235.1 endopeptidase La [Peptostreptococcus sp. CBA3647]